MNIKSLISSIAKFPLGIKSHYFALIFFIIMTLPIGAKETSIGKELDERSKIPHLTKVFDQERSNTEDIIYFRNNDVLRGKILNSTINISTPYGNVPVQTKRIAGASFEGSNSNTETLVTTNWNRFSGIVTDRSLQFKIGTSDAELTIRKEKIRFIIFRKSAEELGYIHPKKSPHFFVMTNGDLVTGNPVEEKLHLITDYGKVPVSFSEIQSIQMQGAKNVTAVITKKNGDIMRGSLDTEEISLALSIGFQLDSIYKDKFSLILVGNGHQDAITNFPGIQPITLPGIPDQSDSTKPVEPTSGFTNSVGMKFVDIPAGEFWMGSSPGSDPNTQTDEIPQHLVTISKPFQLGLTEVTQEQWVKVTKSKPWEGQQGVNYHPDAPATYVDGGDVLYFIQQLNALEDGGRYRLPTEAEWKYANRAGSASIYHFGDDFTVAHEYAWIPGDSENPELKTPQVVGTKKPNAWGIFDMQGNVAEFIRDENRIFRTAPCTDPTGRIDSYRDYVVGTSIFCSNPEQMCRSAYRAKYNGNLRSMGYSNVGFRILRELK